MKEKLNEYARLKREIKELEQQVKELQPMVVEFMQNQNVDQVNLDGKGLFSLSKRRTYRYPAEVQEIEEELKEAQTIAEQNGTATYEEKSVLKFQGYNQ